MDTKPVDMFKFMSITSKVIEDKADYKSYEEGVMPSLPETAEALQRIFIAFKNDSDMAQFMSKIPKSLKVKTVKLCDPGNGYFPAIECSQLRKLNKVTGEANEGGDKKMQKFLQILKAYIG